MISYTSQRNKFGILVQNSSAENLSLYDFLANIEQKYLLQKYFNNEASFSITTVGSVNLTLSASPAIGAVTSTLASNWTNPSGQISTTFSDGEIRNVTYTNGSTSMSWQGGLIGLQFQLTTTVASGGTSATLLTPWAYITGSYLIQFSDGEQKTVTLTNLSTAVSWTGGLAGLVQAYFNTSVITTQIGVGGQQYYNLPPDYSKLKTGTLTIGNLKWTPTEILTRQEWDNLNVFPYYADIPSNFFIWNDQQFALWPIPSTTGNIISFNYKRRVPDLSIADYTTPGTISVANGSTTVTGSSTVFTITTNAVSESRYIQFAPTATSSTSGDNLWYQIASVNSATSITLVSPYQGTSVTSSSTYVIGQMPVLPEDFQDMILWKCLAHYFGSIVDNPEKYKQYQSMYDEKLELLAEYSGSKTVQVNLARKANYLNPNLFWQG